MTIGYSFGDKHINYVIKKWLNRDSDNELIIIDREGTTENDHSLLKNNYNLQESDRIELRPVGAEKGIRDLFDS